MPSFGKTCVHKKNLIIVKEKLLAIFSSSLSHFSSKALLECIFLSILRDRFITVVNVMGDAMGTGIVQHLSRDELDEIDEKNNNPTGKILKERFAKSDGPDSHVVTSGVWMTYFIHLISAALLPGLLEGCH